MSVFFREIETERLRLRNISYDDREFILKQFSDDAVNRYLFDAEPVGSLEEADEIIGFYVQPEPRAQHRWVIEEKASGEKIGTCGFHCWDREAKCVDVGYDLQKDYWGQGMMREALRAVLAIYVPKMEVRRIYAHIAEGNARSVRLAEALGFAFGGETEMCAFHGEEYLHYIYALDCGEM